MKNNTVKLISNSLIIYIMYFFMRELTLKVGKIDYSTGNPLS